MKYLTGILLASFFCVLTNQLKAQSSYRVLFLGNSYTSVNNLPAIVHDVALSAGDTIIFDSYSPGGYQLLDHTLDPTSQSKIMSGSWDYVVIQGQSQEPITQYNQFNNGGLTLYNQIKQYNSCAVTVPFMTWGRKNGDPSNCAAFSAMCTYQGMDSTIKERYLDLTSSINGEVCPVSVVWNYLRQNYPMIELYQADESHPSVEGSYAAACCFYTALLKKDPTLISFDFGLNATRAAIIRNAVKTQVFDHLQVWDFKKPPFSKLLYQIGTSTTNEVLFKAVSNGVRQVYFWDFGDGATSSLTNPAHAYSSDGTYTVSLTTTTCDLQGIHTSFSDTVIQFCSHTPTIYTTNPWLCHYDTLRTQVADSYQWFINNTPLPETNQYLDNYSRYGSSGFSVITTINGCSELSVPYTVSAEWSGYYFDAMGDPCTGDTVIFAVLHTNSFLSGTENILWYRNNALLPMMTNEDTLLITTSGTYFCKVSNPNAICPSDTTTSFILEFNCGTADAAYQKPEPSWSVSPNPASETITLTFSDFPEEESILIYSAVGRLERSAAISAKTMDLPIHDLPGGIYYIRLKYHPQATYKFIKQ